MKKTNRKRRRSTVTEPSPAEHCTEICTDAYNVLVNSLKPKKALLNELLTKISKEQDGIEDESSDDAEGGDGSGSTDEDSDASLVKGKENTSDDGDDDDEGVNGDETQNVDGDALSVDEDEESDAGDNPSDQEEDESDQDDGDSCDPQNQITDPFQQHYGRDIGEDVIAQVEAKDTDKSNSTCSVLGLIQSTTLKDQSNQTSEIGTTFQALSRVKVKENILKNIESDPSCDGTLSQLQQKLFTSINSYKDVFYSQRTFGNGEEIRQLYCLHAINHVLKTRSKVLKNNAKLAGESSASHLANSDAGDAMLRDQGLTRPKVLILTPFREGARRIINNLVKLAVPNDGKGQVMKKKRFHDEFNADKEEQPSKAQRPDDFNELFAGNIDDCFRVGITVMRKAIKLYADFYSADIIVASPLGLRLIVGADGDKQRDFDFLSSIEVLIVDQADVFLMQNWEHVLHTLDHLHRQPMDSHGVDFSRVRLWALNGWAKYYRQTLLFSSFITPELNSVVNKYFHNFAGSIRTRCPSTAGVIKQVTISVPQVFHRVDCHSLADASNDRFEYFVNKVLPNFRGALRQQTAIFLSSYFDFVRLRNYFKKNELSFVLINEYSERSNISKARAQFYQKNKHFLLFTERFYFYYRYKLRGIRHILFYDLPIYAHFYSEIVNSMDSTTFSDDDQAQATCTVLYTKYDACRLEGIAGTRRANAMLNSERPMHMFCAADQ